MYRSRRICALGCVRGAEEVPAGAGSGMVDDDAELVLAHLWPTWSDWIAVSVVIFAVAYITFVPRR